MRPFHVLGTWTHVLETERNQISRVANDGTLHDSIPTCHEKLFPLQLVLVSRLCLDSHDRHAFQFPGQFS